MKNNRKTSPTAPSTQVIALDDDAAAAATGAGLWQEVKNFFGGLNDGYKDHDTDTEMQYGGPDGMDPPNA